jgi:HJR/Mrr/RecB family endonuclease
MTAQAPTFDWAELIRQAAAAALPLWPFWVLLALVVVGRAALWAFREWRLARSGITAIDMMDGTTFERRLVWLFQGLGYRVDRVGRRGDYGADLVVERNGERVVVQAKRWTKNVGVKAVQEAHSAPAMYECSRSMVVTNRYFTQAARKLARANRVELWDRDQLVEALLKVERRDAAGDLAG